MDDSGSSGSSEPLRESEQDLLRLAPPADGALAVAGDTIVVACCDTFHRNPGGVYAVTGTGAMLWRAGVEVVADADPVLGPMGLVYVCSTDAYCYALSLADGQIRHRYLGNEYGSAPAIGADGTVFIGTHDDGLLAQSKEGRVLWTESTLGETFSPVLAPWGTIVVGSVLGTTGYLSSLRLDGTVLWSNEVNGVVSHPPCLSANGIYTNSSSGVTRAISPGGDTLWEVPTRCPWNSFPVLGNGGEIFCTSNDGALICINQDGLVAWEFRGEDQLSASPTVGRDGIVYVGSLEGSLLAISSAGALLWKLDVGSPVYAAAAELGTGRVAVGSHAGVLTCFLPDGTKEWSLPLQERWNSLRGC